MSKLKILIVEDEPIIAADLRNQLVKLGFDVIDILDSGEEAIIKVKSVTPDVILMDIQLEGDLDGIDTAHEIKKLGDIPIIYLTSNTDNRTFARAKFTQPAAYLSKPFRTADIVHSIDLATSDRQTSFDVTETESVESILEDRIFIRNKSTLHKVMLSDIIYIEADGAYCKVVTEQKDFVISSTLKKFQEELTFDQLIRVHRSFSVNVGMIDQISDGYVLLGDQKVPVGRSYKDQLSKFFRSL